jgi:photosystem II stability/assembly factor-like uncharacterized protein
MIDDLELLRRYMNSAPPPPQADLDSARRHLDAEIDREISLVPTTTAGHTRLVRPTDLSQRAWRIRVAFTAAVAILVCAAVVLPLVRTGSPPGRGPTPSSWKLAGYIDHPTFQAQPSSGSEPGALTCPTTTTCYATGLTSPTPNYSAGFGPPSVLEVTQDGGSTWQQLLAPSGSIDLGTPTCPDSNTCMVVEQDYSLSQNTMSMLTTHDGGQTWTSLPFPGKGLGELQVSCPTASDCVALEAGPGPGGPGIQYVSYRTSDGGADWLASAVPGTFRSYSLQCFPSGLCIATGQVPGEYRITNVDEATVAGAMYSTDYGASWTLGTVPPGGVIITALSCSDAVHCMSIEKPDPSSGQGNNMVLETSDGGRTWTPSPTSVPATLSLEAISCPTASDCWASGVAAGTKGAILSTSDGGQTWTIDPLPTIQGSTLVSVDVVTCPTVGACFALASEPRSSSQSGQQVVLSNADSSTTSG